MSQASNQVAITVAANTSEVTTGQPRPSSDQYTTWTLLERRLLVVLLGYLALASSLIANIYFPLIDLLADRYDVSIQAINLTVTLYIIVQGIVPSFWSPLSDSWGRRPVYLSTFTIFTLASLGLAIVDSRHLEDLVEIYHRELFVEIPSHCLTQSK
jgi:Na+/melibiose symporter-like transporter